ncbi:MAG: hypothetical protein ABI216_15700 [Devosia sp.]
MGGATLGAGNVDILLGDETVTLRPTLRAAQTISKQSGGIVSALQAVSRFDFDVISSVIALGLNKTSPRDQQDIAEKVYETGLSDLIEPVTNFLAILANGGRPVTAKASDENP